MSVLVYYLLETCWKYMDIYTKLYKYIHGTILWKYMEHNYIMELYYGNTGTQCWFELFHCTVAPCFLLRIHLPRGPGNPAELHRIRHQSHQSHQDLSRKWSANGEAAEGYPGHYGSNGSRFDRQKLPTITSL